MYDVDGRDRHTKLITSTTSRDVGRIEFATYTMGRGGTNLFRSVGISNLFA
jgi:hypothetical protein